MYLSNTLKTLRDQQGWSQEQLAEKMDVSRQAIAKWENGTAVPELPKMITLAALYQVSLDELILGYEPCTRILSDKPITDRDTLIDFLLLAAVNTYAGKGQEAAKPTRPGSHDLYYGNGDLRYVDTYLGSQHFIGEEALFVRDACVWGMNYCGRTLSEGFSGDFLKAALLLRPKEMPFRGPKLYREGRYTYHNDVSGDWDWFSGVETIYCDEEQVYRCVYHGGSVLA